MNKAIILAAGKGSRLAPLTDRVPKPLVEVNGKPIIVNALENLAAVGVKDVYIVKGYLADVLELQLGSNFKNLNLHYILNKDYANNNSMYSLWLGMKVIGQGEDILVLEGDVFFEKSVLNNLSASSISWFGDSNETQLDGCYLKAEGSLVKEIKICRNSEQRVEVAGLTFLKSVGILAIKKKVFNDVIRILEDGIANNKSNLYYDLIFAENLKNFFITAQDICGKKWFEIDSPDDLAICEQIFKNNQ